MMKKIKLFALCLALSLLGVFYAVSTAQSSQSNQPAPACCAKSCCQHDSCCKSDSCSMKQGKATSEGDAKSCCVKQNGSDTTGGAGHKEGSSCCADSCCQGDSCQTANATD